VAEGWQHPGAHLLEFIFDEVPTPAAAVANAAHIKFEQMFPAKDGHQRCDVDRRSLGLRPDQGELVPEEDIQELSSLLRAHKQLPLDDSQSQQTRPPTRQARLQGPDRTPPPGRLMHRSKARNPATFLGSSTPLDETWAAKLLFLFSCQSGMRKSG